MKKAERIILDEKDKAKARFVNASLIIPTIEAAAGKNWLPTLMVVICSEIIMMIVQEDEYTGKVLRAARTAAIILITAELLRKSSNSWTFIGSEYLIPLILISAASYACIKGEDVAIRSSNVFRYGIYAVLIIAVISGTKQVNVKELRPKPEMPDALLAAVMLLPIVGKRGKTHGSYCGTAAIITCLLTGGTVSLFEYSRTLSINGITEHIESIAACAAILGWYGFACYMISECARQYTGQKAIIPTAIAVLMGCVLKQAINPIVYAALVITLWVIIPGIKRIKKKIEKKENNG